MTSRDDAEHLPIETAAQWRHWLEEHHDKSTGVWLVSWRRVTGRAAMTYDEAITEAVAFGWVDSQSKTIDDERSALWFVPRRPGSPWSRTNKERVARLEAEGRMTDAGRRLVETAKVDGTWSILDDADALIVPEDLGAALAAAGARDAWDAQTPGVRRAALTRLVLAKRAETRARYVEQIVGALTRAP
ncbi:MAG TPA: YdeI/OmpD-associated family protein [Humibacter sp.]|nr:YdeI/OmpD-associated family protein [Humibacter sp.]